MFQECKNPVRSTVSGKVFERDIIEKFIRESGRDPTNFRPLTQADLVRYVPDPRDDRVAISMDSTAQLCDALTVLQRSNEMSDESLKQVTFIPHLTLTYLI
jgi:hypothetical protein